jgi:hypothetical protein
MWYFHDNCDAKGNNNTPHMQWSVLFRKNGGYFGIEIILPTIKCSQKCSSKSKVHKCVITSHLSVMNTLLGLHNQIWGISVHSSSNTYYQINIWNNWMWNLLYASFIQVSLLIPNHEFFLFQLLLLQTCNMDINMWYVNFTASFLHYLARSVIWQQLWISFIL